ncbi:universal stress protein [Deinococcus sonorensis]|uniref:Universal stress protein n=2 Tax=Deinococcus sonorensis TaxID=309891 RepID=A0AAU7U531_9DEIO
MTATPASPSTPALYHRVLVASGGAPHSVQAVQRAVQLARHFGAELHLVVVVPAASSPLVNMAAGLPGSEMLEADALASASATRQLHLQQTAAQARAQGLTVHEHLIQAMKPADAILSVAREVQADLIVLGRRHTSAFSAAMAGSTGDAVSHAATADVLIAR